MLLDQVNKNPNSPLNGDWIDLGAFDEVRNFVTRSERIAIQLTHDGGVNKVDITQVEKGIITESANTEYLSNKIFYLSAHRDGPMNVYTKNFDSKNIIGKRGEFLVDLLNQHKTFNVDPARIVSPESNTLEYQVNYWLGKMLNVKLDLQDLGSSNLIAASYSFDGMKMVRPYHIGAGISYMMGMIILGLYIEKGSVLIIENPEIHLHPKAQSDLADFFCFIAKAGVQVVLESHSDHIFNGIRKSIYRGTITNDAVKIHFFKMNKQFLSENHLINLSPKGKILDYQEGLFDQFDNDLDELLGL